MGHGPGAPPGASRAAAFFERLKALEGEWQGESTRGWTDRQSLRTIAGGSVVMSTSFDAHPGETMVTLYHLDGERLMLTHYCVAKNQPRLVASEISADGSTATFSFLDGTGMTSRDAGHMDELVLQIEGTSRFTSRWTWYQNGSGRWLEEIRHRRVEASGPARGAGAGAASEAREPAPECDASPETAAYIQSAVAGWELMVRDILHLPAGELPWMILFDRQCAYHLGADPESELGRALHASRASARYFDREVAVRTTLLGADVRLPSGASVPVDGTAFASLSERGGGLAPFFVAALPEVWATDPRYRDDPEEDWAGFVLSVLAHEMVHTRQLLAVVARVEAIHARIPGLPVAVDDDLIQLRFASDAEFEPSVREEIALLFEAAGEPEGGRASALARRALDLLRARRATRFGAAGAAWGELEDLFLNMEGVACWAAYRLALVRAPGEARSKVLDDLRDNRKWWSQEEGLALFLVIDRFANDWIPTALPPELASPVDLLERALAESPAAGEARGPS